MFSWCIWPLLQEKHFWSRCWPMIGLSAHHCLMSPSYAQPVFPKEQPLCWESCFQEFIESATGWAIPLILQSTACLPRSRTAHAEDPPLPPWQLCSPWISGTLIKCQNFLLDSYPRTMTASGDIVIILLRVAIQVCYFFRRFATGV